MSIWICIVIGVILGFVAAGILKAQLKSVHRKSAAANYLMKGSLHLTVSTDHYLYTRKSRRSKS